MGIIWKHVGNARILWQCECHLFLLDSHQNSRLIGLWRGIIGLEVCGFNFNSNPIEKGTNYFSLQAFYQLDQKFFIPWTNFQEVVSALRGRHCEANLGRVAKAHEHSSGTFGWRDALWVGKGSCCRGWCLGFNVLIFLGRGSKGHMW